MLETMAMFQTRTCFQTLTYFENTHLISTMSEVLDANIVVDPDGDVLILLDPIAEHPYENDSISAYNSRVLVSSKLLSVASPVFRRMFRGSFKEGIELKTTNKLTLPLPKDDPAAMKILINIFHGQYENVPGNIHVELLAKIAILVDYDQCH
ncbi:hypothetical protein NHQ30_006285 [Ciborinia camelliae]|nr:hypothetical protein NHQ30_006285 [Ciborinia camelliae]